MGVRIHDAGQGQAFFPDQVAIKGRFCDVRVNEQGLTIGFQQI